MVERLAYEVFGERRYPNGNPEDRSSPLVGVTTDRGFTAHEHLDEMMLIHMNGRIYDPVIARFMTADPYVDGASNLQNFNRYSYVNNNPLMYTDPTGYFKLKRLFKPRNIIAVAVAYFTAGAVNTWYMAGAVQAAGGAMAITGAQFAAASFTAGIVGGAAGGFAANLIATNGDIGAALRSGIAGGITGGLGSSFGDAYSLTRVAAESLAGGLNARIRGGRFADGFRSGLLFSGLTYGNYLMRQTAIEQSSINPDNISGESAGLFGDGRKIGGSRRIIDPDAGEYLPCMSPMGGCQGAPLLEEDQRSNFFGKQYNPGSWRDRIVEAFGGPHDFLRNATGAYDQQGNARYLTGARLVVDEVMNYSLVLPAAPFAGAALAPRILFDALPVRKRR